MKSDGRFATLWPGGGTKKKKKHFEILKSFINRGWADPAILKGFVRCLSSCVGHFDHFAFWWPDRVSNRQIQKRHITEME